MAPLVRLQLVLCSVQSEFTNVFGLMSDLSGPTDEQNQSHMFQPIEVSDGPRTDDGPETFLVLEDVYEGNNVVEPSDITAIVVATSQKHEETTAETQTQK